MDMASGGDDAVQGEMPRRIMYPVPEEMHIMQDEGDAGELVDVPEKQAPEHGTPPSAPPVEYGDSIRKNALHLQGEPITQLSTSRLMAFVTSSGAHAKGIEWINDTRCVVVFETAERAADGLRHLCYDPIEEDVNPDQDAENAESALLRPRLVMAFPSKFYNTIEQSSAKELPDLQAKMDEARMKLENAAEPVPEIYRDMEMEEAERRIYTEDHRRVKALRQSWWIRFALHNYDTKSARSASKSNWYKQHGRGAGKEVVTRLLDVGDAPANKRRRSSRRERRDMAAARASRGEDMDEDYTPLSLRDRIGGKVGHTWENDEHLRLSRERSVSPDSSRGLSIRGRGSVRAPHLYDE